jgi:hypothetical protein
LIVAAFVLGTALGLGLAWQVWPVRWYNTDPSDLRIQHQIQYVLATADSMALTGDAEMARQRISALVDDDTSWAQAANLVERVAVAQDNEGDGAAALRVRRMAAAIRLPDPTIDEFETAEKRLAMAPTWVGYALLGLGVLMLLAALLAALWLRRKQSRVTVKEEVIRETSVAPSAERRPRRVEERRERVQRVEREAQAGLAPETEPPISWEDLAEEEEEEEPAYQTQSVETEPEEAPPPIYGSTGEEPEPTYRSPEEAHVIAAAGEKETVPEQQAVPEQEIVSEQETGEAELVWEEEVVEEEEEPTRPEPVQETIIEQPRAGRTEVPSTVEEPEEMLATFEAEYLYGDDDFDCSFSIEAEDGSFLGECGVGIGGVLGADGAQQVDAFEVWLFDKGDIRTVTKILSSEYSEEDDSRRAQLDAKGEIVVAHRGLIIDLETLSLRVRAVVTDFEYAEDDQYPNAYFQRLEIEMAVQRIEDAL